MENFEAAHHVKAEVIPSRRKNNAGQSGRILCIQTGTEYFANKVTVGPSTNNNHNLGVVVNWTCTTKECGGTARTVRESVDGDDFDPVEMAHRVSHCAHRVSHCVSHCEKTYLFISHEPVYLARGASKRTCCTVPRQVQASQQVDPHADVHGLSQT